MKFRHFFIFLTSLFYYFLTWFFLKESFQRWTMNSLNSCRRLMTLRHQLLQRRLQPLRVSEDFQQRMRIGQICFLLWSQKFKRSRFVTSSDFLYFYLQIFGNIKTRLEYQVKYLFCSSIRQRSRKILIWRMQRSVRHRQRTNGWLHSWGRLTIPDREKSAWRRSMWRRFSEMKNSRPRFV